MSRRAALLLLIFVAVLACKRKPATPPDVIVRVGERTLMLSDLKRYLERNAGTDLAQMQPEVSSAMLDQFVEEVILSEYAAAHGVEVPAETIATAVRKDAGATVIEKRDEMRRQKLISNLAAELTNPSQADVAAYYQQHQEDFKSGEEVRVRQILVRDEELAGRIVRQLQGGASFGDLSAQHSLAPNGKKGGEIGWVSHGELPKMFEDEIFRLQPGKVSSVIRTDSTFHIFQVDERRPPGAIGLLTAEPVIRERIREDAVREKMSQLVGKARRQIHVSVLTKHLPFKYSGGLRAADE